MLTLIHEDAENTTYERVTPAGIVVEVIPKNPDRSRPVYKSAAVKIAAEKLGMLDAIDAAVMLLVDQAGDKSLYVWWAETDAISRGDAQWIEIEAAVDWGKSSAAELFALAAQV